MSNRPLYIDVHILQSVPPSCINRDDTGSPKTARYGGVRRARVSSQAWKKATRDEFQNLLNEDELGKRTKQVVAYIAQFMKADLPDTDTEVLLDAAEQALKATGIKVPKRETGYLVFISPAQAKALAALAVESIRTGQHVEKKSAKSILNVRERPTLNAIDIALFGRMVADDPQLNVDAAVQVAHAIGVGVSEPEFDYFTAMDDFSPEDNAGAGMIGTVEYLSATLYRYATIDVLHLCENLGSIKATQRALEAFLRAFVTSMPTGKQNTFANRTLPAAVIMQLRDTQPVSLVGAFEKPVYATESKSITEVACERLAAQEASIDQAFGVCPLQAYAISGAPAIKQCFKSMEADFANLNEAISNTVEYATTYLNTRGFAAES